MGLNCKGHLRKLQMPPEGETIAVWFSCGAASAVAAKLSLEKYGHTHRVRIINNPVLEEDPDNRRFLADVEEWLGVKIEIALNPLYPSGSAQEVWSKRRYMGGVHGAPCTIELKKKARQHWEACNLVSPVDSWIVLGFTSEEQDRFENFRLERPNLLPILLDAKLTKRDCWEILTKEGLILPRPYRKGLPNANCIGCVKATSPTYWNKVRQEYPEQFADRARQSRELGVRLVRVKGKRIFLDELDPSAKGGKMHTYECGIFCSEG